MPVLGKDAAEQEYVGTEHFTGVDAAAQRQRVVRVGAQIPHGGKPHRVSISCMCAVSGAAGPFAALFHTACVKWTWLFQKPATTVLPVQSITRASGGIWTSLALPTALMTPLEVTTTASAAARRRVMRTRCLPAGPASARWRRWKNGGPSRPRKSAAWSQWPNKREASRYFITRPERDGCVLTIA